MSSPAWNGAFRIGAVYLALAALWIVGSDYIVNSLFNAKVVADLQTVKGLFYVTATGAGLVWLIKRELNKLHKEIVRRNKLVDEKQSVIKELHHRVKNNLQLISSLISLQRQYRDDQAECRDCMAEIVRRINVMAAVHEQTYREADLDCIDADRYFNGLIRQIERSYRHRIEIAVETTGVKLPVSYALPCGIIVSELVDNIYSHAFPDNDATGKGSVLMAVTEQENGTQMVTLTVKDDGVGIEPHILEQDSLGLSLIRGLAAQLKAEMQVDQRNGTTFTFCFEISRNRLNTA